jgi:hypothetical protein
MVDEGFERFDRIVRILRAGTTRRGMLAVVAGAAGLRLTAAGAAGLRLTALTTQPVAVTIDTSRLRGSLGDFSASGGISDAGTFTVEIQHFSAAGAPTFLIVHATYAFAGTHGTFTMRVRIKDTFTADPNVLTGEGTWEILGGTGAYAGLQGQGKVTGVLDETEEPALFLRTFTGIAQLA